MTFKTFTPDLVDVWLTRHGFAQELQSGSKARITANEVHEIGLKMQEVGYANSNFEYYTFHPDAEMIFFVYPEGCSFSSGAFLRDIQSIPFKIGQIDILSHFAQRAKAANPS